MSRSASGENTGEDIADIVGHASIRITAEVYRHHVQPTITAGKAAMDQMFGEQAEDLGVNLGVKASFSALEASHRGHCEPVTCCFVGGRYRT